MMSGAALPRPGGPWRSVGAVVAGLVAVVALSTAVDTVLHAAGVYPPPGQRMDDPWLNLLALSYRLVITVFGCWLAARLAPGRPMRHALILGGIGLALAILGVFVATSMDFGPIWYPISLVLTALPCAWLGGRLARKQETLR